MYDIFILRKILLKDSLFFLCFKEPPYVMRNKDPSATNSTQKFVGFCIDILLELSERLNFTFEIEIVKDETFGKRNDKGEWNGIIGELVNRVFTLHPFFVSKNFINQFFYSESRFRFSWLNNHVST